MIANDITTLRAKACAIVAALGAVLDDLETAEQTLANPSSAPADVLALRSLLGNASSSAASLVEAAHELTLDIDQRLVELAHRPLAEQNQKGGAS